MNIETLYKFLDRGYATRDMWISEVATALRINKTYANILTIRFGVHRGKLENKTPYSNFASDPDVIRIAALIS